MEFVDFPDEFLSEVDFSAYSEGFDWLPGGRIQGDQVPAAVDENPPFIFITPHRNPAVAEAAVTGQLPPAVCAWVVAPVFLASARIESDDAAVRCAHVHRIVDDDGGGFEATGTNTFTPECEAGAGHGLLTCIPCPRDLEPGDALSVNLCEGRVLHPPGVTPVDWPIDVLAFDQRSNTHEEQD